MGMIYSMTFACIGLNSHSAPSPFIFETVDSNCLLASKLAVDSSDKVTGLVIITKGKNLNIT